MTDVAKGPGCDPRGPRWAYRLAGVSGLALASALVGGVPLSLIFPAVIDPVMIAAIAAAGGLVVVGMTSKHEER